MLAATIQQSFPGEPELAGRSVVVVGLGRTGLSLCRFLAAKGARVTASDSRPAAELAGAAEELERLGVTAELGGHQEGAFTSAEMIVLSPGVPPDIEPLREARRQGVEITGEIELASRFVAEPIIAVTGTNGKTTVTSMLGEIFRAAGRDVFVGGNIGFPLIDYAAGEKRCEAVIIEVSSFQLETAETLHPQVGVLLNLSPDHLDRYPDYRAYTAAKVRLFRRQGPRDFAVLNADDPAVWNLPVQARRLGFSRSQVPETGACVRGRRIEVRESGRVVAEIGLDRLAADTSPHRENVMAAVLAAWGSGLDPAEALNAAARFEGLPHRMEFVGRRGGASYYDDSKATNPGATAAALEGMTVPVVLIAGGRDKDFDFTLLKSPVRAGVRRLILVGEAADKMHAALQDETEIYRAEDMADAVRHAAETARPGEAVLLSPACASFDMFDDYAHRGRVFAQLVKELL